MTRCATGSTAWWSGRQPMMSGAAASWEEATATLAGDPERRGAMATQARLGADRFDVTHRIHEVEALYRELLDRTG